MSDVGTPPEQRPDASPNSAKGGTKSDRPQSIRFSVVTIFPEMFQSVLDASMLGRARAAGIVRVDFIDPRAFTSDRHRTVDDAPYGGGPGMVMKVEPLIAAIESITSHAVGEAGDAREIAVRPHRILMSPVGAPLGQKRVQALAKIPHIVLVCGRYEGIDERVSTLGIDEELSMGDFVLTGGEIAAMAVIDAVARYVPGVLGEATSTDEESFSDALLEYPQYTRPSNFRGASVPDVLLSGHHARIADWRRQQSIARTAERRPDVLATHRFDDRDRALWRQVGHAALAHRTHIALVHHPVYDRKRGIVTSAVTNFDIHDIARSSMTYGLAGYVVVTPVAAQRDKVERIVSVWRDGIQQYGADNRVDALSLVTCAASIEDAASALRDRHGATPVRVGTSARSTDGRVTGDDELRELMRTHSDRPLLLVLGTGWGLADEVIDSCDAILAPISGVPAFNHLSVRSAAAVILDRLFGIRSTYRT